MKKRVVQEQHGTRTVLAEFALDANGTLIATWRSQEFKETVERGITAIRNNVPVMVTPADGREFFDALDAAYARSTFLYVETVP